MPCAGLCAPALRGDGCPTTFGPGRRSTRKAGAGWMRAASRPWSRTCARPFAWRKLSFSSLPMPCERDSSIRPRPVSESRRQEVKETDDTRRQRGIAVVHRIDRLTHVHGLAHEQLHQVAASTVGGGHEVGKAGNARTFQSEPAQGFSARRGERWRDRPFVAVRAAQRPAVERFRLGKAEQAMSCEAVHVLRTAMCGDVRRTGQYPQATGRERTRMQRRVAQGADADRSSKSMLSSSESSSRMICGCARRNSGTSGAMTCSMNGDAAFTRNFPTGCWRRAAICSSASSTDARIARVADRKAWPSSVSSVRRVVRRNRVVSSFVSSRPSARLMPETV